MTRLATLLTATVLWAGSAQADIAPAGGAAKSPAKSPAKSAAKPVAKPPVAPPAASSREPSVVARQSPEIAALIKKAQAAGHADAPADPKAPTVDESVSQVPMGGQCGFAGCSSTTLVAFTYRTRGANTMTSSVLALVSCPPMASQPCTAVPAEVRATSAPNPRQ
jgi:hypothetical protein